MPLSRATFLERRGFHRDPFDTVRAERERDLLPAWFVPSELFTTIVGTPTRPEPCLVFAPTGHGKTSHRIEMARRVQERADDPALAVSLTDFSGVLGAGAPPPDLDYYLTQLRVLVVEALADQLRASGERLRRMQADSAAYARFCALLALFAPDRQPAFFLPPNLEGMIQHYRQQPPSAQRWLGLLVGLTRSAGFASLYVLVDGVDEWHETRDDLELQARVLAPLLNAAGLLDSEGVAFKFFLPIALRELLLAQRIGRLEIMRSLMLEWRPQDLVAMLEQRLIICSQLSQTSLGSTRCFSDLCAADFDVDLHLAKWADCSPRELLRLADMVVTRHLARSDDPDAPIAAATVLEVAPMAEYQPSGLAVGGPPPATVTSPEPPRRLPNPAAVSTGPPLLFVDKRGDVWLGNRRIAQKLPRLRQRCLDYLWAHRNRRVSSKELADDVYRDDPDPDLRADPTGSLRKLIRNLREDLEPGMKNSLTYIDNATGFGYVLRNFRDE